MKNTGKYWFQRNYSRRGSLVELSAVLTTVGRLSTMRSKRGVMPEGH